MAHKTGHHGHGGRRRTGRGTANTPKQKKSRILANTLFAIRWNFRINPGYTVLEFIRRIVDELITLVEHTFLPAYIITCVEEGKGLVEVLQFLIPVAIAVTVKAIGGPLIDNYIAPKATAKFYEDTRMVLYKKAAALEIAKYDDTAFYNDFVWAMHRAPEHLREKTVTLSRIASLIAVALIAGSYIVATDTLALSVVAVILGANFFIQHLITKRNMRREEEIMPTSRKRDYCNRVFYLANFVKDIKTGDIADKLKKDFRDSTAQMEKTVLKHNRIVHRLSVLRSVISLVAYDGCYLIYLFYQALVKKKYTLGGLLAVYNAANRLQGSLQRTIMLLPQFEEHSLYIEKLRTFLEAENAMPDNGTLPVPPHGDLTLEDVRFTYTGNDKPTLSGISMHIARGEKVALVGFNGAGKSTLIKLLLRLYDPDSGTIRFGGEAITDYPLADYRARFGALFQDYEIIAASIGENIAMSDTPLDRAKADEVVEKAAFAEKLESLEAGYDTPLTKEFDDTGVNLSGGEAQKIALARVLYSDASVLVLDEPSGALDPIAEYTLNKTVTELAADKSVIIISHRLSTTRFVDKIFMLEDGRVIEQGNHDDLIAQGGKYAEMFRLQAEKYR